MERMIGATIDETKRRRDELFELRARVEWLETEHCNAKHRSVDLLESRLQVDPAENQLCFRTVWYFHVTP